MNKTMIAVLFALAAQAAVAGDDSTVAYPEGYRDWRHVKSMVIEPGHPLHAAFGGIHHLYANAKAVQGYRSGHFPDGAVIVFDLLEAHAADNAITEGPRKIVGVMVRDSKRHAATGGWGFEGFRGGSSTDRAVGPNAASACFGCHQPQKDKEYVFSNLRD